jgi:hypothetical protein
MTARSPEYLELRARYRKAAARAARLRALLPARGEEVPEGDEAVIDMVIIELHAVAAEINETLDRAEIVVGDGKD